MAITKTDLCNLALLKLSGAETDTGSIMITSITGTTKLELICAKLYPFCRREVLARAEWDFATMYRDLGDELSGDDLVEAAEWEYQFALPETEVSETEDYAYIKLIRQTSEKDHTEKYNCEVLPNADSDGFVLCTNDCTNEDGDSAFIKYIWDNDEPATYSPLFIEAFTTLLASKLAATIKTMKESQALKVQYESLDLSQAANIEQEREYEEPHETWFDKRTA